MNLYKKKHFACVNFIIACLPRLKHNKESSTWSKQQNHANLELLRLRSMFSKRHDVGFFLQSVHICLCKRLLHEKNFRKALWCVIPWLNLVDETPSVLLPPKYLVRAYTMSDFSLNMACGQGMELNRVLSESLKGKLCATYPRLKKIQLKFYVEKPCHFCFLPSLKWKKKSFQKRSFILFGRYGQVLP